MIGFYDIVKRKALVHCHSQYLDLKLRFKTLTHTSLGQKLTLE